MSKTSTKLKMLTKVAAGLMLGVTQIAMAQNAGKVAQNVAGTFNYMGLAVQAFFGLAGLVLIGLSIFTLIKYNKTEGQGAKLSTFAIYLVGGGALFYIASLIQTTGDTIWGDGQGNRTKVQIQAN